ncbi:MAG: hypothetical protein AAF573_08850 [Bacteroidota bacterium]
MKKVFEASTLLLLIGFIIGCLYLTVDDLFFDTRFWMLGVICVVGGAIGFWVSTSPIQVSDNSVRKKVGEKH